jgi:hypothetical protein
VSNNLFQLAKALQCESQQPTVESLMNANWTAGFFLVLAIGVGACSPSPIADKETLAKEATASVVAGATADQVSISQLESGAATTRWRAEAGGKIYACDADELLRLPDCRPAS